MKRGNSWCHLAPRSACLKLLFFLLLFCFYNFFVIISFFLFTKGVPKWYAGRIGKMKWSHIDWSQRPSSWTSCDTNSVVKNGFKRWPFTVNLLPFLDQEFQWHHVRRPFSQCMVLTTWFSIYQGRGGVLSCITEPFVLRQKFSGEWIYNEELGSVFCYPSIVICLISQLF